MPTVALQQVTSNYARENAKKSLEKPVNIKYLRRFLESEPDVLGRLEAECSDGKIFVWGAKLERIHQYEKMFPRRCLVLFRRGDTVYKCGVITERIVSLDLAEYLWSVDTDDETWGLVYFLRNVRDLMVPAADINKLIGRKITDHWQGLVAVSPPKAEAVIHFVKAHVDALRAKADERPPKGAF